jgi:uncharacterized protein (DUF362 family)
MQRITRREALRGALCLGLGAAVVGCAPQSATSTPAPTAAPVPPTSAPSVPTTQVAAPTVAPTAVIPATATSAPLPTATSLPPTAAPTARVVQATAAPAQAAYMAVVRGTSAEAITTRAIAAIGGMERFCKNGYDVIIKPNICNANNGPEYASTTNPEVVATLVKLCLGAGAKRVRVMDYPFAGSAQAAYARSGIEAAVKAAGGEMELMARMRYADTKIPEGKEIKSWNIYQPILEADLVINLPIAKHHGLARLTLAGKNLMGMIEDRPQIHRSFGQRLADLATLLKPQLTVVDAVRILMANGPTGGNLDDVKKTDCIIASHDMVAADAYATTLFGLTGDDISYIGASEQMGLGTKDLKSIKIAELNV